MTNRIHNVLSIAGHDPTGGAGIQADLETINSIGCHACSVVTTLTVQNTQNVSKISPVTPDLIQKQLQTLIEDINVDAIKIGLLGALDTAKLIARYLSLNNEIPVVFDPILAAGGGATLADSELVTFFCRQLLPLTTITTPNSLEARQLAPECNDLSQCAEQLLSYGCQTVLITGTHESGPDVMNQLFDQSGLVKTYHWPRLANQYHGSGCTLSAAIATRLAQGATLLDAVEYAQQFTWDSLNSGYQPGRYQFVPNRN